VLIGLKAANLNNLNSFCLFPPGKNKFGDNCYQIGAVLNGVENIITLLQFKNIINVSLIGEY